jgi:hypothetical protein
LDGKRRNGSVVSKEQARYQSLASCGAVLIAFIGVCHEVAGHILFPWGPAALGGPIGWHGTGISSIVVGVLLLAGTLGFIGFPVVPFALVVAIAGAGIGVMTAVVHHEFHLFAFTIVIAGATTAFFHRRGAA